MSGSPRGLHSVWGLVVTGWVTVGSEAQALFKKCSALGELAVVVEVVVLAACLSLF